MLKSIINPDLSGKGKKWLLIAITLLFSINLFADVQVGDGTTDWTYPFNTWWMDTRLQSIYLASEIDASGTIDGIKLYVDLVPGQVLETSISVCNILLIINLFQLLLSMKLTSLIQDGKQFILKLRLM